jgi:hypothetical protein
MANNINLQQLEMNVNLHSLQPNFLNRELHYVIASDENTFRFAELNEQPQNDEQRLYCFLTDKSLTIPAGDINLNRSYVLDTKPVYPVLGAAADFLPFINCIDDDCTAKAIRNFSDDDIKTIQLELQHQYGTAEMHLVRSPEFEHLLLILPQVEISISATMVYFKQKFPETCEHYNHLQEEKA